jgi:hypothetical protein
VGHCVEDRDVSVVELVIEVFLGWNGVECNYCVVLCSMIYISLSYGHWGLEDGSYMITFRCWRDKGAAQYTMSRTRQV